MFTSSTFHDLRQKQHPILPIAQWTVIRDKQQPVIAFCCYDRLRDHSAYIIFVLQFDVENASYWLACDSIELQQQGYGVYHLANGYLTEKFGHQRNYEFNDNFKLVECETLPTMPLDEDPEKGDVVYALNSRWWHANYGAVCTSLNALRSIKYYDTNNQPQTIRLDPLPSALEQLEAWAREEESAEQVGVQTISGQILGI